MDKNINLNAYKSPTFWVTIDDLRIPVAVPDVATVELLFDKLNLLAHVQEGITEETYNLTFEMLALMLSSNHNFMRFEAEELKKKNITISQIIGVLTDWVGFISELANSKN